MWKRKAAAGLTIAGVLAFGGSAAQAGTYPTPTDPPSTTVNPNANLPETGSDSGTLALGATALLVAGGGLVLASRKRASV